MGTVMNGNKWSGACVNGKVVSGLVKNGEIFYKKPITELYKRRIMISDNLTGKTIYNTFNENDWNIFEEDKNKFLPGQELGSLNIVKANKINDYGNEICESFSEHGNGEYEGKKILNVYASFYHENFSQWGNVESVDIFSFTEQVGIDKQENVTFINDNNDRIVEEIIDTKAYRKLFIEDSNIRPLKVGDKLVNGTKLYFNFPDDFSSKLSESESYNIVDEYGDTIIYISKNIVQTQFVEPNLIYLNDENIGEFTNKSVTTFDAFSSTVSQIEGDLFQQYVFVDKTTLGA